jgi:methylthioribose-1-phosphate isomerase
MALAARKSAATDRTGLLDELVRAKKILDASRFTAVNLSWATGRMLGVARKSDPGVVEIAERLLAEAHEIRDEDKRMCRRIGEHGAALLGRGSRVLTHCNAGGLATTGYGTALAPIRMAHEEGKELHVFVDETRPFLQGARLTAWELREAGIPLTLITDSMAAHFMGHGPLVSWGRIAPGRCPRRQEASPSTSSRTKSSPRSILSLSSSRVIVFTVLRPRRDAAR